MSAGFWDQTNTQQGSTRKFTGIHTLASSTLEDRIHSSNRHGQTNVRPESSRRRHPRWWRSNYHACNHSSCPKTLETTNPQKKTYLESVARAVLHRLPERLPSSLTTGLTNPPSGSVQLSPFAVAASVGGLEPILRREPGQDKTCNLRRRARRRKSEPNTAHAPPAKTTAATVIAAVAQGVSLLDAATLLS